ncbi:MAG TPA: two-component regulator propeller domain-containing protein [Marinilabiliaceae bacterium]|nr:two-component regulator propeller domain-containing protein [Marinilabiliaceae bacterium]
MHKRHNFTLRSFILSLLLLLNTIVFSANYPSLQHEQIYILNHFSALNKTPGQSIQCVFEDHIGMLWLGIESIGLSKYNGKTHVVYQNDPEDITTISNNYPLKIIEDNLGYIWVATANGLNRFDRRKEIFKRYHHTSSPNSLSNNVINDLLKDEFGNIWIATANGVNIFNPEKEEFIRLFQNDDKENPANDNFIHSVHISKNGNIWIGTAIHGMLLIEAENYRKLAKQWDENSVNQIKDIIEQTKSWEPTINSSKMGDIRAIHSNHPDTIWISSQLGLYYFLTKQEKFHRIRFSEPGTRHLNTSTFQSLLIDSSNTLWAGSTDNGIVIINLNNEDFVPVLVDASNYALGHLKSNAIREIIETQSGLIWIATKFGGLHYFDRRQETFPLLKKGHNNQGLSDNFVTSAIEDSQLNLWFGTKSGGLTKLNRETGEFTYYNRGWSSNALPSNRVESIVMDDEGTLWIGTKRGLVEKQAKKDVFNKFLNIHIRNLYYSPPNLLWIGTSNGLYRFSISEKKISPLRTKHTDFFDIESNIGITRLLQEGDSILWIATSSNGLFEYHLKNDSLINHINELNNPFSLCGNQVRALHIDKNDNLWVGTKSAGLCLYNRFSKQFISKSTASQLPSNTVYNIIEDEQGNFWLGTHEGVSCYHPKTDKYYNYSTIHGLQSPVYEINSFAKTHDGLLMMGGNQGINIFDPKTIGIENYVAPMIISSFNVFNTPLAIDIDSTQYFILESQSNYISFEFALLDYSIPDENKYSYILEPFDEDWIESGTRNFAAYTNLPSGEYTFKAIGINSSGVKNTKGIELKFYIPAPIWKQTWFITSSIILVIIIAFSFYRLKIIASRKRETELKKIVQQRTQDLYAAYQKLSNFNKEIEKHNKKLVTQRDQISQQNKELEMHRTQLQSMVLDRTRDLEAEKLKAQESDRLKSAFLANMSHEIRTPLNAIMGFLDLLQTEMFDEEEKKDINNIIQQNSNDLLQLINDIIDISIIEADQLVIKKKEVNINEFLEELTSIYSSNKALLKNNIQLLSDVPNNSSKITIHTDPVRLRQIFINLINNALKFTNQGYIKYGYKIDTEKEKITFFVEDSGIGISLENQAQLFIRFNKIEPTLDKVHRGTGLGLSISKHLCELLGGTIKVKSELGKGSAFYFTFPLDKNLDSTL